jgi:hypothetical protein
MTKLIEFNTTRKGDYIMLSRTQRLAIALRNGGQLTAKQVASRFRVVNPHDLVYRLRNAGMDIELNSRINSKGDTVLFYSLPQRTASKRRAA